MPTASELPIDTTATAEEMADEMFGNGVTVVSASYTGAANASGTYSDGDANAPEITPSDTGVILSTGSATSITNSSGDANASSGQSTNNSAAGDADLSAVSGQTTFDAAVLEAEFIPVGNTLTMQLVFSSEEYLEYVNSGFNDAVGVWVNGTQAKLSVGDGNISIDEINDQSNSNLYVDNPASAEQFNTEMDGFTITLTLKAPVNPGEVNTIKIGIADGGDGAFDSNLLIAGDSVQTALIANDDNIEVKASGSETFDLLENDASASGSTLTITEINGQPVSIGDTVALSSGEQITLTSDGLALVNSDGDLGESTFTYTVADEDGNSDVAFVTLNTVTPCFTLGTRIDTARGPVPIETLRPGDQVLTLDHGLQPLRWIGTSSRYAQGFDAPVRIEKGAFGDHDALEVSPQHRLFFASQKADTLFGTSQVLIKAKDLTNLRSVRRRQDGKSVIYMHLLFDRHEIVCGNGIWSESYQPGDMSRDSFDSSCYAELLRIMPGSNAASLSMVRTDARTSLKAYEAQVYLNGLSH